MYQPQQYFAVLLCMILSMLCWGSWANTRKLSSGFAFSLYYWDYVLGIIVGSLFWAFTLGSLHGGSTAFLANMGSADLRHWILALAGGVIFNAANLLLVAAIDIAGMAVAFPIGIGLALIVGVVLSYVLRPTGNPFFIFGGVALVAIAIGLDAQAYRRREPAAKTSSRGILLSLASGLLMGVFYPFVARSTFGAHALGPYSVSVAFSAGVLLCTVPLNLLLMRRPLTLEVPSNFSQYRSAKVAWHVWGLVGGAIWCTGAVASFVATDVNRIGPAVSYALGQGATMISAIWGVFIWKEFASAPKASTRYIPWMFLFFIAGLGAIAAAPLFAH